MSTTALPQDSGHAHGDEHAHDPHLAHHFDTPEQQFSTSKLGIWLFLATEVLMFGGLFCVYAVYRYNHPQVYLYAHNALDPMWGMINTIVLLASSFTMAWGVRAAQLNQKKLLQLMLVLTFLGGIIFMCIKTVEYQSKWKYHLFPGKYNAFNNSSVDTEGTNAADDKSIAIKHIEEEAEARHGSHHAGEGGTENGTPNSVTESSGPNGGAPHVENNSPNAQSNEHPNVAAGANNDQPSVGQPVKLSDTYAPIGNINRGDGNAGTPDAANIAPPAFGAGGTNPDADQPAGHQWKTYDQMELTDRAQINTFFSIYFMMTGLHGIHVLVGMGLMAWLFIRATNNEFSSSYFTPVDLVGLYWHLVDLIWIFLFPLLYLIH